MARKIMPLIRLVLVLGIIGLVAAFAVSNGAPGVALVFLGMPTPTLPLAVWVLGAMAAGMATTLALNTLFSLSNYWAVRQVRPRSLRQNADAPARTSSQAVRPARTAAKAVDDEAWQNWEGYEEAPKARPPVPTVAAPAAGSKRPDQDSDDWDFMGDDDWDAAPASPSAEMRSAVRRDESAAPGAKSGVNARSPQDAKSATIANQSKLVVDADYRVIVPPYKPPTPPESSETD
jgi:uncharacterized integral membrane protein